MKIFIALFYTVFLALLFGGLIATPTGLDPFSVAGVVGVASLFIPSMTGCLVMAIDISELKTELGDYFRQHKREIVRKLFQKTVTMMFMTTKSSAKGQWAMSEGQIGSVVQPFQKDFTPKGDPKFVPNLIQNRRHKVDIKFVPDDVEDSWLAFLYDEGLKRSDMPITKYIVEQLVIPRIAADRENKIIGKGVFKAVVPGTPGEPEDGVDGFLKVIDDGIAAGKINEVSLDPLTPANTFDAVEEFADAIDEVYQDESMPIFMSKKNYKNYHRDKRNTHGQDPSFKKGDDNVDFTENRLVSLPSMSGSDTIFATPKINFIRLIDKIDQITSLNLEQEDRKIKVFGDWWEAPGFGIDEAVWASSPTAGSASVSGS